MCGIEFLFFYSQPSVLLYIFKFDYLLLTYPEQNETCKYVIFINRKNTMYFKTLSTWWHEATFQSFYWNNSNFLRAIYWFLFLLNICFILLAEFMEAGPMRLQIFFIMIIWSRQGENHNENVVITEITDHRSRTLRLWIRPQGSPRCLWISVKLSPEPVFGVSFYDDDIHLSSKDEM
jgi:hypothetical protein